MLSTYFGLTLAEEHGSERLCALGGVIAGKWIDVRLALPLLGTEASGVHVKIGATEWFYAIQTFTACGLTLVGSAHTHPGMRCFLSGPDRDTHATMFPKGTSIVVSPGRREIAAFLADGRRTDLLLPMWYN
jgi:hypothetical protein